MDNAEDKSEFELIPTAGEFGGRVRQQFEELTGNPVVSPQNFLIQPKEKQKKLPPPSPGQASLFDQPEE